MSGGALAAQAERRRLDGFRPEGWGWQACAFCTPEFERYRPAWMARVSAHGGTPNVVRIPGTGDWARNTGLKPQAILDALITCRTGWMLYTDIDAAIHGPPAVPDCPWDLGLVTNPNPHHRNRVAAACLFVRHSPGAIMFLGEWVRRCREGGGIDHPHLTRTIEAMVGTVKTLDASGWIAWTQNGLSEEKPGYPS